MKTSIRVIVGAPKGVRRAVSAYGAGLLVAMAAFVAGATAVQAQMMPGQPMVVVPKVLPAVTIQGNVRFPRVAWHEDLTLAHALLQAEYQGQSVPTSITILRNGKSYSIGPRQLLSGRQNPLLNPGDIVRIQ